MNKLLLGLTLLCFTNSFSQTFGKTEFEFLYNKQDVEKASDKINAKGFVKQGNATPVKLIKKAFDKRSQTLFEEIITVTVDTLTYSFSDPKKYAKFKGEIDAALKKHDPEPNGSILFTSGRKNYILTETDEQRDGIPVHFYNFKYFKKND